MNEVALSNVTAVSMVMDPARFGAMMDFAKVMSESRISIPEHLRGKPSDCAAIVMQAMTWGMNPYAVASKTHVTNGGVLGYEGQLINAVIIGSAPVAGRPEFEFVGDWSKILGKVMEREGKNGGKYYVSAWDKKDEDGLGVIVSVQIRGESSPRSITVMMSQAWPRFSTLWATDPQQQLSYLAVRKLARRYFPDVILGVYDMDEAQEIDTMRVVDGERVDEPPKKAAQRAREAATKPKSGHSDGGAGLDDAIQKARSMAEPKETVLAKQNSVLQRIEAATTEEELAEIGASAKDLPDALQDEARAAYANRLRQLRAKPVATPVPQTDINPENFRMD